MTELALSVRLRADGGGLVAAVRKAGREIGNLGRSASEAAAKARRLNAASKRLGQGMERARRAAFSLRTAFAALGVGLLVREVLQAAVAFDRIQNSLRAATGSAAGAEAEYGFLRDEVDRLGLDLESAAGQFAALSAAARGTALEGKGARDIFVAVSEASTVMGLSAEQTAGALVAIQQMISKGTVSAEELRGQLGERLPGAFQIAARAIGVTTQELGKMLEQGNLTAEVLLPAMARELGITFGPSLPQALKSAQVQLNRFQTAIFDLKVEFARSGFIDGFTASMDELRGIMQDPGFRAGLRQFGAILGSLLVFMAQHSREVIAVSASLLALMVGARLPAGGIVGPLAGLAAGIATYLSLAGDAKTSTEELTQSIEAFQRATAAGAGTGPGGLLGSDAAAKAVVSLRSYNEQLRQLIGAQARGPAAVAALKGEIALENEALKRGIDFTSEQGRAFAELFRASRMLETQLDATERAARREIDTRRDIRDAWLDTLPPMDAAIERARVWRFEALSGLDATKAGYDDFAAKVDEVFRRMLRQAYDDSLRDSREWSDGAIRAMRNYADAATDAAANTERVFNRAINTLEDDFARGELSAASFVDTVNQELRRLLFRQTLGPLIDAGGSFLGQAFSPGPSGPQAAPAALTGGSNIFDAPFFDTGGLVGKPRPTRPVAAALFRGAPSFGAGGEVPAILHRGEGVFTPRQMGNADRLIAALASRADSGVTVQVIDQRSGAAAPVRTEERRGPDGQRMIAVLIEDTVDQGLRSGRFDGALSANFGVGRQGVSR